MGGSRQQPQALGRQGPLGTVPRPPPTGTPSGLCPPPGHGTAAHPFSSQDGHPCHRDPKTPLSVRPSSIAPQPAAPLASSTD